MNNQQPAKHSKFAALVVACSAALVVITFAGCQQKMAGQPSYRALEPGEFFADHRSARPLVAGTVARGHLRTDLALFTGRKTRAGRNPAAQEPAPQPSAGRVARFDENR